MKVYQSATITISSLIFNGEPVNFYSRTYNFKGIYYTLTIIYDLTIININEEALLEISCPFIWNTKKYITGNVYLLLLSTSTTTIGNTGIFNNNTSSSSFLLYLQLR